MKLLPYFILLLSFLGIQNISQAQDKSYVNADFKMADGTTMSGIVRMPIMNSKNKIVYRTSKDGKKQVLDADDIDYLLLNGKEGDILLKRDKIYMPYKKKPSKQKMWLMMRMYCENFQTYVGIMGFEKDKAGNLYATYADAMGMYLIQREGEDYPHGVGSVFIRKIITGKMFDKQRKTLLEKYYSNDAEALKHLSSIKRITQQEMTDFLSSKCEIDETK